MIPSTLKECFEALDILLNEEDKQMIQNAENESVMILFHNNVGRWIRNNWRLWNADSNLFRMFKEKGIWHADDMSGIILNSYYRVKHNLPIELEKQIEYYLEYWKQNKS